MHRRASALFLGLFAVSAALQGAAACNGSSATPSEDAGASDSAVSPPDDSSPSKDTGTPTTTGCTGPAPIMTVNGPDGGQIAPDWSCYVDGAAFLFRPLSHPFVDDAATDDATADDAASEASIDAGTDAATPPLDAGPDVSAPDAEADATAPIDAAVVDYALHLSDFVSNAPPVGATVKITWGGSSIPVAAFTGTVDDAGIVLFPPPPSGQQLMSYEVTGSDQTNFWFLSSLIVPPTQAPGRTEGNSISTASAGVLLGAVLGSQKPTTAPAIVITGAEDCQFRDVNGGQFQIIDTTTGQAVESGTTADSPRAVYLQDNLPNPLCTFSSDQGRAVWAMINAPVDTSKRYMLQFSGRMTDDQLMPVLIDEVPVETYPGTATAHRTSRLNTSPPN